MKESVVILMPTRRAVDDRVVRAITKAAVYAERNGITVQDMFTNSHDLLPQARCSLAAKFLDSDAYWAMCVDDDVIVPEDAIVTLVTRLRQGSSYLTATGLVYGKRTRMPNIFKKEGTVFSQDRGPIDKDRIIDASGMDCMLINHYVFKIMEPPYFAWTHIGEDLYFCNKLKDFGFHLLFVPDVRCGHILPAGTI